MWYFHEIIGPVEANKMHFTTPYFVYKQDKWTFFITSCYIVLTSYDIGNFQNYMTHMYIKSTTQNITVWPFDVIEEFTKGFSMKMSYQHPLFVNKESLFYKLLNIQ